SYSSSTSKQIKLSPLQKENIIDMFALECKFEHIVHSMVLDVSDKTWLKYFTPEEIQEIKNHQMKVPADLLSTIRKII
ncbi:hypothetical protein INT48_006187, partial [Thamnidium elegans]